MWWILLAVYVVGYLLTSWPVFRLIMQASVHDRVLKNKTPDLEFTGEHLFFTALTCLFWPLVLGFFISHRLWTGTRFGLLQELLMAEETSKAHDRARTELRRQHKAMEKAYEELDVSDTVLPPSASITYEIKHDHRWNVPDVTFQDVRRRKYETNRGKMPAVRRRR